MFSYRHAYHAGNHADVLKHSMLLEVMQYMQQKSTPVTVIDTHAGIGSYNLDGLQAQKSGEYQDGIARLRSSDMKFCPLLANYLSVVADFAANTKPNYYPGSPFLLQALLREQDRQKLFELHPSDVNFLTKNVAASAKRRQTQVLRQDGFVGALAFLPPPSKRALVVVDPSYEIKTDYSKVAAFITKALNKFVGGTYFVWLPVIARTEAHELAKKLKQISRQAGRSWVYAGLQVRSAAPRFRGEKVGISASAVFVINPPYTLAAKLKVALPQLVQALGQDKWANFALESGQ